MFASIACTYIHYLGFCILFSTLVLEHILLKPNIDADITYKIILIDLIYGISALMVLVSGTLKVLYFGMPTDYYLHSTAFFIKIGLFIAMAILSIPPTLTFLKWRKQLNHSESLDQTLPALKPIIQLIRIELLCVILIPLFAILMARDLIN